MNTKVVLRRLAAAGAIAALGAVGVMAGVGAAAADTVGPAKGSSSAVDFSREVSGFKLVNGKVPNGETITITNRVNRKLAWLIYYVKDTHPSCMQAVPNTSVWTVSGKTYTNDPNHAGTQRPSEVTSGLGWTQIKPPGANSWESVTWTQDYLLMCDVGALNTGGLQYSTTWVGDQGSHPNVGPTVDVTPGVPGISVNPKDAIVNNDVQITIKNPDGRPGDKVVLTSDGKTLDGCGNLELDGNRRVTCTWVPKKAGKYPLKAVISSEEPVTVTDTVHIAENPASGSVGMDTGSIYTGSLGDLVG
ncbi:hypothetical protein [Gordonia neofelifaecis]|uniref:Ig-like domain-containing protein n=1 Tax=Gordonia neofelifaecis NRRL B-59395 TaxID=644548 RepID=F1YG17_9ACTN|nr:hypothetical protein [Gordonia neofelifaecis]EGD56594.1 hypothetical protein SCNU_03547 [Gordonia neofelifaecis NRRL B-59395]